MSSQTIEVLGGVYKVDGTIDFTDGTVNAAGVTVTGFRFDSTTTNGLVLTSSGGDGTATWAAPGSPAAGSDLIATDNVASGLIIRDNGGVPVTYITFNTLDADPKVVFNRKTEFGANAVSGSNFTISGGSATGLTSLQLNTTTTNGYVLTSTSANGTATWAAPGSPAAGSAILALDNNATGLEIKDVGGVPITYITFNTLDADPKVVFNRKTEFGANLVSGSNFSISGGTATGLTAFQLDTAAAATGKILASSDVDGNADWITNVSSSGAAGVLQVSDGSGDFAAATTAASANSARITNLGTPTAGTDAATKQYVDDTALDLAGSSGQLQFNNGSGNLGASAQLYWTTGTSTLTAQNLTVPGNLDVQGTLTTIGTNNLVVDDNTIILNNGEAGAGVTAGTSGFSIDRGSEANYSILFDEADGGVLKSGIVGSELRLAHREDTPTDNGLAQWDAATKKFETTLTPVINGITLSTSLRLDTTTTNGYVLTSSGANGTATWAAPGSPAAGSDIIATDNTASGLIIRDDGGVPLTYITFNTLDAGPKVVFGQTVEFGSNAVSGSNFSITGGDVTGLDSFQLNTTTTNGYVLTSSASNGTATWAAPGSPAAGSDLLALNNNASGLVIRDVGGVPLTYITFNTLDAGPKVVFGQTVEFGANDVSGSNFSITGGDVTGLDSFQLNTTTTNGYVLTSSAGNGTATWAAPGSPAAGSDLIAVDNNASGLIIRDNGGVPLTYVTFNTLDAGPKVVFNQTVEFGANDVSGSNFSITGGDVTGLDSFQLATTSTDGLVLVSSGGNGTATWAANTQSGWTDDGTVVRLTAASDTVAIGTASHSGTEKLRILNGAVLFDGTTGAVPVAGAGTRLMWCPAKSAFRAGLVTGTEWDNANVGTSSFAGGADNTASGATSTAFGSGCTASATSALAVGTDCTASQTYAVALGNSTTASGDSSFACGTSTTASGNFSAAFGNTNTASGVYSIATGLNSTATRRGQKAHAAGQFSALGDAQSSVLVMWRQTTNNTATELTLDGAAPGAGNRLVLDDRHTYLFNVDIVARREGAADESAAFKFELCMDRQVGAASTALVGGRKRTIVARDQAAWTCDITADATNGSVKIDVTGENTKNIKWVAFVRMTEVAAQT